MSNLIIRYRCVQIDTKAAKPTSKRLTLSWVMGAWFWYITTDFTLLIISITSFVIKFFNIRRWDGLIKWLIAYFQHPSFLEVLAICIITITSLTHVYHSGSLSVATEVSKLICIHFVSLECFNSKRLYCISKTVNH